jgi:hypothetical protein
MLPLRSLLIGSLLTRERLRFILMPSKEFRRLPAVIILDSLPLSARTLGFRLLRGFLALLLFLQMLTLESLRLGIMLLLKLPQLLRSITLGRLLLLDALALELLQFDVMFLLERRLLHPMLTFYRLAHRIFPIGMTP